jgi:hypothetical protein
MEEYLTTVELSVRIKMAPGTIRNLVWKKEFQEGIHFVKPTSGKLLFAWSAVERWLYGKAPEKHNRSLINI